MLAFRTAQIHITIILLAVSMTIGCKKKVPDLTGLTREEAEDTLKSKKLKAGTVTTAKTGKQPGTVVDQNPKPGGNFPADGTVALVLEGDGGGNAAGNGQPGGGSGGTGSAGPTVATVPKLVGLSQADAEAALTKSGLVRGNVDVAVMNDKPEGKVFDANPAENTQVAPGSVVDLRIAAATTVEVPRVLDQLQAAAEQKLRDAQLSVGDETPVITSSGTPGTVVEQNPDPGIRVAKGQPVRLKVKQPSVRVPRVVGMNRKDAQIALFSAGLTPVLRWAPNPNLPLDQEERISTQTVPEGTEVAKASQVGIEALTRKFVLNPHLWMRVEQAGTLSAIHGIAVRSLPAQNK